MKKILVTVLCAITTVVSVLGFTACGGDKGVVSVYMPDGAPALSMAKLMVDGEGFDREVDYHVVNASLIQTFVTGENSAADLCVLPLNLASKLLGNGQAYKMLGTVTHGNLYILKKQGGADITAENISSLVGKTVGVIQLAQVPGLTFEVILKDNDIGYNLLGNGGETDPEKVNLKAVEAEEVIPSSECDYFVVPEPAAATKVEKTTLEFAGDLQALYGGEGGYPQAVLVAKTSLIESSPEFISDFEEALTANGSWLSGSEISGYLNDIVGAINKNIAEGSVSSLNAENLNKTVIEHCAINYVPSHICFNEVNLFLEKLIAVNPASASTVASDFYYIPQE